jgi:hypothetical protein
MYFVDFNKLAVKSETDYSEVNIPICFSSAEDAKDINIREFDNYCVGALSKIFDKPAFTTKPCLFNFTFNYKNVDDDTFISCVHIILSTFFLSICTVDKREREYRLDVPDELKLKCHAGFNLLKRAINYKTLITDQINIHISCGDYRYNLVEQEN